MGKLFKVLALVFMVTMAAGCTSEESSALPAGGGNGDETCAFDQMDINGPDYTGRTSHFVITVSPTYTVYMAFYADGNAYAEGRNTGDPWGSPDSTGNSFVIDSTECTLKFYDNGAYRYLLSNPTLTGSSLATVDIVENPASPTVSATDASVYHDFSIP